MKSRKSIYTILTLLIALLIYFQNQNTIPSVEQDDVITNQEDDVEEVINDSFNYLPTSTTNQLVKHKYYSLSYHEKYEQAEWVAYVLKPSYLKRIDRKRPYFINDKKVKTKSASYRNYKQSGYDKGHLVPAGDMRFSLDAFNDTFYTSNISPQNHSFNAGIWNRLEQKTRYWTKKYGNLYVITGGILTNGLQTIGREKVAVPNQFYKILLKYTKSSSENKLKIKAIAFLIANKKSSKAALYQFVVSIDKIEELTGIDFFSDLPDDIEARIEANSDYKEWSFR